MGRKMARRVDLLPEGGGWQQPAVLYGPRWPRPIGGGAIPKPCRASREVGRGPGWALQRLGVIDLRWASAVSGLTTRFGGHVQPTNNPPRESESLQTRQSTGSA